MFSRTELGAALMLALATSLFVAPAPAHAGPPGKDPLHGSSAPARYSPVTSDLEAVTESAEEVYDLALSGKMERAARKMETLKKQAAALSYIRDEGNSMLLPRLGHTLSELDQALALKNRLETMRYANRITLIAATVEIPYKPSVPTEVALLEYNGRELGISAEMKKTEKLANIVMRMHLAWQALMPKLVEHNGTKELRRFSDTMGRLEAAKTPDDYGRLSKQVITEMTAVRGVFGRAGR